MGVIAPQHPLHAPERQWPETNCYIDLWIELLHARGLDPHAMLGFGVLLDYEGDQFTFSKPRFDDLSALYGLAAQELSIYDSLERHTVNQVRQGNIVLIEADAFFLEDTRATTYRQGHSKTTIGVHAIDPDARRVSFFHNAVQVEAEGEDYDGLFAPTLLPPYVERVRARGTPLPADTLRATAVLLLQRDLCERPRTNPVTRWRADFSAQMEHLIEQPDLLHGYAFNFARMIGSAFELLASQLAWLDTDHFAPEIQHAMDLSTAAKAIQFRWARMVRRKKIDPCTELLDQMEQAYAGVMSGLTAKLV